MTTKQFIDYALKNGPLDFDKAYSAQCTDLFRFFHKLVIGSTKQPRGVVGAKDFWSNYDSDSELNTNYTKISNTPDFVPIEGDVAIWKNGTYGHIAICTGEGDKKYFMSLDQNWTSKNEIAIVRHNYINVYGVLRPKLSSTNENMQEPQPLSKLLDHIGVKNEAEGIAVWDREMAFLKSEREKNDGLRVEVDGLKARAKELQESKQNFIDKVANKVGSISDESRVLEAIEMMVSTESQKDKKIKDLENAMVVQENTYKTEIEQLKREIDLQNGKLEQMIAQNKRLIERVEVLEEQKETTTRIKKFITDLINLVKGSK